MCLSSFPRYSDGTGVPDPVLDPQCKKNMDTLQQVQQTPLRTTSSLTAFTRELSRR